MNGEKNPYYERIIEEGDEVEGAAVTETPQEFIEESVEGVKWMPLIYHRLLQFNMRTE